MSSSSNHCTKSPAKNSKIKEEKKTEIHARSNIQNPRLKPRKHRKEAKAASGTELNTPAREPVIPFELPEEAVPAENGAKSLNLKEDGQKSLQKEILQPTDSQEEKSSAATTVSVEAQNPVEILQMVAPEENVVDLDRVEGKRRLYSV